MKMTLKKETKHTCVYEAVEGAEVVPVRSVYVDKVWLAMQTMPDPVHSKWPATITLTVQI